MEIKKHIYCCQNMSQDILDHIIPVPDDFNVNPNCLYGISKDEFISGLKTLTKTIQSMYTQIVQNPAEYGLPVVEDIRTGSHGGYSAKAGASAQSAFRLVTTLHTLVSCGDYSNNEITVDKKRFTENSKKLGSFSVANVPMIMKKLCDNGFIASGFNGKSFDKVCSEGDFGYHSYRVGYMLKPKDKSRLIESHSNNGNLQVRMRLRNIDRYVSYLETLPERVKQVFRKESNCRNCQEPCGQRYSWTFEGVTYTVCAFGYWGLFDIACYEFDNVEFYKQIIHSEIDAIKNKGRK